jgi:5-methyltetrahydrofolate--homocysteine methyltransferase
MVSSMMTATPLAQEPPPTLVGERVNSQGSRKAKEMLLADDYDGLVTIAEDQVQGGAHVLDLCVALTERQDEDEQMRQVAKRVSLTQPAPLQIDSTEPEVIERALEQTPGRAIVNSINLEAGRDKADRVIPLAKAHGAALIALTIDEVGMAKTAERKVEIAKRIRDIACEEHGLDPELLIFDALTFTLTTGDEEWRPSAVETIEGIRRIKAELPSVKTSLGVSNVSFGVSPKARAVLNSVFLHHCVEAGLDLAMVNPNHITPYGEIPEQERELTDDLVFNRREDALERFIGHFESKGEEAEDEAADPTAGMEPEEALHWHILRRKKEGVEDWIDRCNEKIGAVPTLNTVLLPAMKEVGDKFGSGELILPFVLQSATVMKRAVAQLEKYLDKIEGHTKGTVVIATVFGDVHDIGKSLVNTILTNNGYTVIDLGKQVPVDTIISAAQEHKADAIGLSALLVSTSKQMPICVGELHDRGLEFPVLVGGAAINRDFGRRMLYPKGKESDEIYEPGVFYCKDAFQGLDTTDALIDPGARDALLDKTRSEARALREKPVAEDTGPPVTDDSVRSSARVDTPVPVPPFWGAREIEVDLDEVFPHLEGRGMAEDRGGGRRGGGIPAQARADVARAGLPAPAGEARLFPLQRRRKRAGDLRSGGSGPGDQSARLPAPAPARPHLPHRLLPAARGRRARRGGAAGSDGRRRGHRAHGPPGARGGVRRAALHARPGGAVRRGPGGVASFARAQRPRDRARPGPPLLVGLSRLPGPVRAHEGLGAAGPRRDRHVPLGRLRRDARAVHGGDSRAPPAGRLLRHEVRLHSQGQDGRRADRRHRARRRAAAGRGPRGGRPGSGGRREPS